MELKDKREELLKQSNMLKGAINRTSYSKDSYEENIDLRVKRQQINEKYLFYKKFMETVRKVR